MTARQLLDPRWHWMRAALAQLHAEMDPDGVPLVVSVIFADAGGQAVGYAVNRAGQVSRVAVPDPAAAAQATAAATVDLNPDPDPGWPG